LNFALPKLQLTAECMEEIAQSISAEVGELV
jgi:hypothetical protein